MLIKRVWAAWMRHVDRDRNRECWNTPGLVHTHAWCRFMERLNLATWTEREQDLVASCP